MTTFLQAKKSFGHSQGPSTNTAKDHTRVSHVRICIRDLFWNSPDTFNPIQKIVHDHGDVARGRQPNDVSFSILETLLRLSPRHGTHWKC